MVTSSDSIFTKLCGLFGLGFCIIKDHTNCDQAMQFSQPTSCGADDIEIPPQHCSQYGTAPPEAVLNMVHRLYIQFDQLHSISAALMQDHQSFLR